MDAVLSDIFAQMYKHRAMFSFYDCCAILNVDCAPAELEAVFIHLYLIRLLDHFLQAVAEEVFRSFT